MAGVEEASDEEQEKLREAGARGAVIEEEKGATDTAKQEMKSAAGNAEKFALEMTGISSRQAYDRATLMYEMFKPQMFEEMGREKFLLPETWGFSEMFPEIGKKNNLHYAK